MASNMKVPRVITLKNCVIFLNGEKIKTFLIFNFRVLGSFALSKKKGKENAQFQSF